MKLLKEPLIHFVLIGLLIFVIDAKINTVNDNENTITVTKEDIGRLKTLYQQNWNQPPDQSTLKRLIDEYIISEIYYQEGLKLNLDHNDEIIKRRLRQKYEFVAQDLAEQVNPSNDQLLSYFEEHFDDYVLSPRYSFYQYYFSPDIHDNPRQSSLKLFAKLEKSPPMETDVFGDTFFLDKFQKDQSLDEIRRNFGIDFADKLSLKKDTGRPVILKSGYGIHVVFIIAVSPPTIQEFEDVSAQVKIDWSEKHKREFSNLLASGLRANYKIVIEDE